MFEQYKINYYGQDYCDAHSSEYEEMMEWLDYEHDMEIEGEVIPPSNEDIEKMAEDYGELPF